MKVPAKVLFSIPTKHHVEIALDEMTALQEIGYVCDQFPYAAKEGYVSGIKRLYVVIKNAFNLIKKSYKFKPDVIYINSRLEVLAGTRDFITLLLFKIFYFKKVHFFIKSHGSDLEVFENKRFYIRKIILPFLNRNISAWLFLSSEEKNKLGIINYIPQHKTFVTKNIVRTNQFHPHPGFRKNHNIPDDTKILLFVGRIIEEKGIYEVIDAFAKIRKRHKTILLIVGDGTELINIEKKINTYNLSNNDVILTGFIPEKEVVKYYSNSDILVFPTFFPEGFPMALFNSVAAGLSIITTRIRAADDYLSEPENCLWVEAKNSDSVYEALDKLLIPNNIVTRMKENNLKKAQIFSKEYVAQELSEIMQKVIINADKTY